MTGERTSAAEKALAVSVTALILAAVASQHYRLLPHFFSFAKNPLSGDALIWVDMALQFMSGQAAMSDWIENPSSFWFTQFLPVAALLHATDGDWRLTLALRGALETSLVIFALATVIRQSSACSWSRSIAASAVPISLLLLLDLAFGGTHTMSLGTVGYRTYMVALFFLVVAGLAKVASDGNARHPLSMAYLAVCLFSGAEDALIGVQVLLPALAASLCWGWLHRNRAKEPWGMALVAGAGIAFFCTGLLMDQRLFPFVENNFMTYDTHHRQGMIFVREAMEEGNFLAVIPSYVLGLFRSYGFSGSTLQGVEWHRDNSLNGLLLLLAVPVALWSLASRPAPEAADRLRDIRVCARFFVIAMYWALVLSTAAAMAIVLSRVRYAYPLLVISPLVLTVAWCCAGRRRSRLLSRLQFGLAGIATASLVLYLAFFRPDNRMPDNIACAATGGVLAGTGLKRGMVSDWHIRENLVKGDSMTLHLMITVVNMQEEYYAFSFPHVGNVGHQHGTADFVSIDQYDKMMRNERDRSRSGLHSRRRDDGPHAAAAGVRRQFGLPSRMEECGVEAWFLYDNDWVSSDDLHVRSYSAI